MYAQTPNVPSTAETGRLNEQIYTPSIDPLNEIIPVDPVAINGEIPASENGFTLNAIKLEGMSAFPKGYFDDLIQEYLGLNVDLNTLNHLTARITNKYREEGYFISRAIVPQQEVIDGTVIIIIIEGSVNDIRINDASGLLNKDRQCHLYKTAAKIKKISPLHGPSLERYVLLLNDTQGITVNTTLAAPQNQSSPGKVDIIMEATENPPLNLLSLNNYGSRFVGPYQLSNTFFKGGLINSFDQLTLGLTTSLPVKEVQFGSLQYSHPLNAEGLQANYSVSYSNSEPGLNLEDLEVEGDSIIAAAEITYPIIRSRRKDWNIGSSFDFRQSATEFLDEELIDDKTRSVTLFTSFKAIDDFGGDSSLLASISKGFNILNATETGSENLSRAQGRSDFFKGNIEASRKQAIKSNFELNTSISAQYTPHPLLSSEEFGYGGIDYGRAYDPSEITGDNGVSAAAELRYTTVPRISKLNLKLIPFAFYDIGKVWNKDTGAKPISAASAGFGAHYNLNNTLNGSVQVAYPLTKSISTPIMNGDDGPRILFNLTYAFNPDLRKFSRQKPQYTQGDTVFSEAMSNAK